MQAVLIVFGETTSELRLKRDIKVAKVKPSGKKGSKWQDKCEAREKPEHVGLVVKQETLQRGVRTGGNNNLYAMKALKKRLTMMKSCKRGACWKKVETSSGKK